MVSGRQRDVAGLKTFHRLVANTLIASVTNNFLWFALTFWVYLETGSVIASSVIGGTYMLLLSVSALFFGTYVDHHRRKTSRGTSVSRLSVENERPCACCFIIAIRKSRL